MRQLVDELAGGGGIGGGAHLFIGRVLAAIADIGGDAAGENHRLLRHHRDLLAQGDGIKLGDVHAVKPDAAALGIEEAQHQLKHGGLARA